MIYLISTQYYRGIKILEVSYLGKVLFLYKKGDMPINYSVRYSSAKRGINEYLFKKDRHFVKMLKKGFIKPVFTNKQLLKELLKLKFI